MLDSNAALIFIAFVTIIQTAYMCLMNQYIQTLIENQYNCHRLTSEYWGLYSKQLQKWYTIRPTNAVFYTSSIHIAKAQEDQVKSLYPKSDWEPRKFEKPITVYQTEISYKTKIAYTEGQRQDDEKSQRQKPHS